MLGNLPAATTACDRLCSNNAAKKGKEAYTSLKEQG